jgi:hypothetical protein
VYPKRSLHSPRRSAASVSTTRSSRPRSRAAASRSPEPWRPAARRAPRSGRLGYAGRPATRSAAAAGRRGRSQRTPADPGAAAAPTSREGQHRSDG